MPNSKSECVLAALPPLPANSLPTTRPVRITDTLSIGDKEVIIAAGPCSVEGLDMLLASAHHVKAAGASILRGGAFKPRTSPYAFQGLGDEGLALMSQARERTGMPIVTEVLDTRKVEHTAQIADVLQVGARNMQNFALLAELGRCGKPVLLKRGASARISELLLAAEHIMANGNSRVILCERGIRTFETSTRNTLDISAIAVLKHETHLPVLVDPSHAGGRADLVLPLALAAIAAGADGLIIEVHPDPATALSDADQQLTFDQFREVMNQTARVALACNRTIKLQNPDNRAAIPRVELRPPFDARHPLRDKAAVA